MTRVAAIDCGTNSIRLLVADVDRPPASSTDLDRRMEIVRLGQGVDRTGGWRPEALERTFAACREYAAVIAELGAERVRFVATSATRDARTGRLRRRRPGHPRRRARGHQRRRGGGAVLHRRHPRAGRPTHRSRRSSSWTSAAARRSSCSATEPSGGALGGHRLRADDRAPPATTDPPTAAQIAAARADIEAALDLAARTVPLAEARTLVGLAGSVTTVAGDRAGPAGVRLGADPPRAHPGDRVRGVSERLLALTHAQRAAIPVCTRAGST